MYKAIAIIWLYDSQIEDFQQQFFTWSCFNLGFCWVFLSNKKQTSLNWMFQGKVDISYPGLSGWKSELWRIFWMEFSSYIIFYLLFEIKKVENINLEQEEFYLKNTHSISGSLKTRILNFKKMILKLLPYFISTFTCLSEYFGKVFNKQTICIWHRKLLTKKYISSVYSQFMSFYIFE